jgi:hypothetical protein
MSEQPGEVSDAQRAAIIAEYQARAREQAGGALTPEQAAAAAQPAAADPGLDAGIKTIAGNPVAGAPLPAEEAQNAAMQAMQDQFSALLHQLQAQGQTIEGLQRQLQSVAAGAAAAQGDPLIVRYAKGVRDKVYSHAVANADLGTVRQVQVIGEDGQPVLRQQADGHFAGPAAVADKLVAAAEAAAAGTGPAKAAGDLAGELGRWFERGHGRASNKHVDFSAAADDAEAVQDEAARLAA